MGRTRWDRARMTPTGPTNGLMALYPPSPIDLIPYPSADTPYSVNPLIPQAINHVPPADPCQGCGSFEYRWIEQHQRFRCVFCRRERM